MDKQNKPGFLDFVKLAKQEYQNALHVHPELVELSPREREVFTLLLTDMTLSEIADELYISYSSVHFHCKNVYRKLQLSSRKQLLIKYKDM
ncbi:MAG: helix-turn-helix transcriptional regulator [Firmicutes bacterium]|nr:helix-turn-helix transcriptional regulator [Bacillota bacterium]